MRFARTTSNGASPVGTRALAGRRPGGRGGSGGRSRSSPRRRSGRCRRRAPSLRRAARRRSPGSPSRSPRRGRAARRARPRRHPLERGEAEPGRRVQPGPERHARIERDHDVAGLRPMPPPCRPDHDPSPDAQHREVAPSRPPPSPTRGRRASQLADRAQAERLEMAERLARLGDGPRRVGLRRRAPGRYARTIAGRVGSRRAPRPSSTSSKAGSTLVPTGRDARQDLADGLDGLDVGHDRQLEPGAVGAVPSAAGRPSLQPGAPARPPRQPSASRTRSRIPRRWPTPASPASSAYSASSSRWRFVSFVGTTTWTNTWRSPREPARRRCGTPRPRSRISVAGLRPGLDLDLLLAFDRRDRDPSSRARPARSRRRRRSTSSVPSRRSVGCGWTWTAT